MQFPRDKVKEKIEESILFFEEVPPLSLIPAIYVGIKIAYKKLRE